MRTRTCSRCSPAGTQTFGVISMSSTTPTTCTPTHRYDFKASALRPSADAQVGPGQQLINAGRRLHQEPAVPAQRGPRVVRSYRRVKFGEIVLGRVGQ